MSLHKKDRSINIEEPAVGAILQPGNNLNSIDRLNPNKKYLDDDQNVFPIGYGKKSKPYLYNLDVVYL